MAIGRILSKTRQLVFVEFVAFHRNLALLLFLTWCLRLAGPAEPPSRT